MALDTCYLSFASTLVDERIPLVIRRQMPVVCSESYIANRRG